MIVLCYPSVINTFNPCKKIVEVVISAMRPVPWEEKVYVET